MSTFFLYTLPNLLVFLGMLVGFLLMASVPVGALGLLGWLTVKQVRAARNWFIGLLLVLGYLFSFGMLALAVLYALSK